MKLKNLIIALAIVGASLEWTFYLSDVFTSGLSFDAVLASLTATSLFIELLFAILIFALWSYHDASNLGLRNRWYLSLLAVFAGGVSLQAAVYFYYRLQKTS